MPKEVSINDLVVYVGQPQYALPPERAHVWQLMGLGKMKLEAELQGFALQLQQTLMNFAQVPTVEKPAKLQEYRRIHAQMVETRKSFTRYFDLAASQCMDTEKTYDPKAHAQYLAAVALELKERTEANQAANAATAKNAEKAAYSAHIKNEYDRIATAYNLELEQYIHQTHTACLAAKTPIQNIAGAIATCVEAFKSIKVQQLRPFAAQYIDDAERTTIFNTILQPDLPGIYNAAVQRLNQRFATYTHDLAAAEFVLPQIENNHAIHVNTVSQQAANRQAATTLTEGAIAGTIHVGTEGLKAVTETTYIVVEDENPNFVLWIVAAFHEHYAECIKHVSVKKYGNLNVSQMAAALDKAMIKVEHVTYKTDKK